MPRDAVWASAWKPPFQQQEKVFPQFMDYVILCCIKIHNGENMKMYRDILNHSFLFPNLLADVLL